MCEKTREALDRIPGVTAQELGRDRMGAVINLSGGSFDPEKIQGHELVREAGTPARVKHDQCGDKIHLESYFPEDLLTVVRSGYKG